MTHHIDTVSMTRTASDVGGGCQNPRIDPSDCGHRTTVDRYHITDGTAEYDVVRCGPCAVALALYGLSSTVDITDGDGTGLTSSWGLR